MLFDEAGEYILNKLNAELSPRLTYHNADHTMDVYTAARFLGDRENISAMDMKLLLTAAMYHDSGYLIRDKGHEEESCIIARETLPAYRYSYQEIDIICGMITATRVPQAPGNLLEKILADADLDYLGRDDFFIIGQQLYIENCNSGVMCNEDEWNRCQIIFIEDHRYFTNTAINLREAKKQANKEKVRALIKT